MTKEEFLSSFSDQTLVILKDYGFYYDTPEALEEEAVKKGLISSTSVKRIVTKEILIAVLVGFAAYALLKNK